MLSHLAHELECRTRETMACGISPQKCRRSLEQSPWDIEADASEFETAAEQRDAFVELRATDTGEGIGPTEVEHIFEPFFTTKAVGQCTGLGLSTVHGIVSQHHGTISVENAIEGGTIFRVRLPAVDAPADSEPGGPPSTHATQVGDETILVAEDNARIRELVRGILEPLGYRVLLAASGEDALDILARNPGEPALLLTDIMMPGMSGPELYERALSQRPELRVLFMSGYTEESVAFSETYRSEHKLLQKPFSSTDLMESIRERLDA